MQTLAEVPASEQQPRRKTSTPFFGFVIGAPGCGEGDTKSEATQQNHHHQPDFTGVHGVPGEGGEDGKKSERQDLPFSVCDSHLVSPVPGSRQPWAVQTLVHRGGFEPP